MFNQQAWKTRPHPSNLAHFNGTWHILTELNCARMAATYSIKLTAFIKQAVSNWLALPDISKQ